MSAGQPACQAAAEPVSPGAVVDEAIGSHADPLAPGDVSSPGAAVDEAIGSEEEPQAAEHALTHIDSSGQARMVDVSAKDVTARTATATGRVLLSPAAVAALRDGTVPKGDALAVARIAAIQGAKRTPDLVPLCHPIGLHGVTVDLTVADDGVDIAVTTRTADRTGVEMESLTAVVVGALALIDMIKAVDPAAAITDVKVLEKTGGKTGHWTRP
jgi:cyclic pyranopterin monophosphate synthase